MRKTIRKNKDFLKRPETAESILIFSLILPVLPLIGFILAIIELIKKNKNIPAAIAGMFLNFASVPLGILYAIDRAISYISSIG